MGQIKLKANINECTVEGWQSNTGEVNARVMSVEMSEDLLTCDKQFVTFDLADGTKYESLVVDGKAKIPIFEESQFVKIGLYAENVDGNECEKRYSAHPDNVYVSVGSFGNADKQPKPTPGDYAELLKEIEDIKNTGGGGSGDGCGITVIDEIDSETKYGEKEVPSANLFIGAMMTLADDLVPKNDFENTQKTVLDLISDVAKHTTTYEPKVNAMGTRMGELESWLESVSERILEKSDKEEWVEILDTTLAEDVAYVDLVAPDGKMFKKLHILVATGNAGLSTASKLTIKGTRAHVFSGHNGEPLATTSGTVNTWGYPLFILEKGALFPLAYTSMGTTTGTNSTPILIGGIGQTHSQNTDLRYINNGPWKLIRIQPTTADVMFKAGVKVYAWGIYEGGI